MHSWLNETCADDAPAVERLRKRRGFRGHAREIIQCGGRRTATAAFFLAFIPQFVDSSGNVAIQFARLATISVVGRAARPSRAFAAQCVTIRSTEVSRAS